MQTLRAFGRSGTPLLLFAVLVGCASKQDGASTISAAGSASAMTSSGGTSAATVPVLMSSGGTVSLKLMMDDPDASSASTTPRLSDGEVCGTTCPKGQSTCAVEMCDGVDNNCDGVIDNIDKNSDGICDCVLIGTLGVKGGAGQGDVFSTWLGTRSNNGATDLADMVLTPDLLAKYQVIVAQDVHQNHPYSAAEIQALQAWITKGGGFMTLIGYARDPGEAANVNTLLQPFAMSYGTMQILPKIGGSTIPITAWVAHPVDLGVKELGIDNGYPVVGGTAIATNGGYNVCSVQDVGKGHILMWGDEWITYDSEWTNHPDYQVQLFWLNAIKWLTVAGVCEIPIPPALGGMPK